MTRPGFDCARTAAYVAGSRVMRACALPAIWYALILALILGVSVVLTTAAVAGPTPSPTATPTATPICLEPPATCTKNSDCCSNICSGGGNKTCQPEPSPAAAPTPIPTQEEFASPHESFDDDYDHIVKILRSGESVDIIVAFEASEIRAEAMDRATAKGLRTLGPDELSYKREAYASVKKKGLEGLEGVTVLHDYRNLSSSFVRVSNEDTLNSLLARHEVMTVHKDRKLRVGLNESLRLIKQNYLHGYGLDGTGTTVAVLDTGIDYTEPPFNCTGVGMPVGECRIVKTFEAAPEDGYLDFEGHGTNVSAVVHETAEGAKLWVADVCSQAFGCHESHIMVAFDEAIMDQSTYNIVAMNMSIWRFGNWEWEECTLENEPLQMEMADVLATGIQPITITGNGANLQKTPVYGASWPGCLPSGVTIGAVYDDNIGHFKWGDDPLIDEDFCEDLTTDKDVVACFSQSFGGLDLYAPGVAITLPGGETVAGTSFAAPHVAGAWAIMRQAMPSATEDEILTALQEGGEQIDDPRFGLDPITSRIDLAATLLPEPSQLLMLGSGIMALWWLSFLRVRDRGLGRRPD